VDENMDKYRHYGKGWHYESLRHSLAARGIKSAFAFDDRSNVVALEDRTPHRIRQYNKFLQENATLPNEQLAIALMGRFGEIKQQYADKLVREFRKWQEVSIPKYVLEDKGKAKLRVADYHDAIDKVLSKDHYQNATDEEVIAYLIKQFPEVNERYAKELLYRHRKFEEDQKRANFARRTNYAAKLTGFPIAYTKQGIPITIKNPLRTSFNGKRYPVTPEEVKQEFDNLSDEAVAGIKEINFRDPSEVPGSKQGLAWAQYARSAKRINIFSQPKAEAQNPENRRYLMAYVLPHEAAHHATLHNMKLTEDPMIVEEARADAMVYGENPLNQKVLQRRIALRQAQFGPKGTV
jgi:hypothetical protein